MSAKRCSICSRQHNSEGNHAVTPESVISRAAGRPSPGDLFQGVVIPRIVSPSRLPRAIEAYKVMLEVEVRTLRCAKTFVLRGKRFEVDLEWCIGTQELARNNAQPAFEQVVL